MTVSRLLLAASVVALSTTAYADTSLYFNGFETDLAGWSAFGAPFTPTRVTSGTNGITSATGSYHAVSGSPGGSATNFGGYNYGAGSVPTVFQPYATSVAVYLDTTLAGNDLRFDYSSAINNSSGGFLRDFVFNAGFYNETDMTAPGAGTDRFVISASNNSGRANSYPQNPGRSPFAITSSGWYTFEHRFYDSGGFLAVDFNIFDSSNTLLNTWTIGGTDAIANVGGNRYGWFVNNELPVLAFDNSQLRLTTAAAAVPEPGSTATLLSAAVLALTASRSLRRSKQRA